MVTLAAEDFVVSACETAETDTVEPGAIAGVVYRPVASIVPLVELPPAVPFTSQFTLVFVVPVTVALNCWVWPVNSIAEVGLICTLTTGGGGVLDPPPPQAIMNRLSTIINPVANARYRRLRLVLWLKDPKSSPITGTPKGSHRRRLLLIKRFCAALGPKVETLTVTVVAPLLPLILRGLNVHWFGGLGCPKQESVTVFPNVALPTGAKFSE